MLATTAWLTRKGDFIKQIDISRVSGLDPNTLSQVLKSLEKKSFIKRARTLNERSKSPILTELGLNTLSLALPAVENTDSKFFESLTAEELNLLIKMFIKLKPK